MINERDTVVTAGSPEAPPLSNHQAIAWWFSAVGFHAEKNDSCAASADGWSSLTLPPVKGTKIFKIQTDALAVNPAETCVGFAKHMFILLCAFLHLAILNPTPTAGQCVLKSVRNEVELIHSFVLLPFLLFLHCHCNGIKSFTLKR